MVPPELKDRLANMIAGAPHPRELAVDVMFALQESLGYLTDEAVLAASDLLGMDPVEIEGLATFYTFVYREPVGRYVIHVSDSLLCELDGGQTVKDYLSRKLGINDGQTTADGLFTLLPVCCIGHCDRAPAMLVNKIIYGPLTPDHIDDVIAKLTADAGKKEVR